MTAPHIVVVGAGPGGEAAAKRAAACGARVTLVEKNRWGGLCLNWGCIPSKALLEGARLAHAVRAAGGTAPNWAALQKKKNNLVDGLRSSLEQNIRRLGVRFIQGEASFDDAATLRVRSESGEETLAFDAAVLATGSAPVFPPPFDSARDRLLDSERALGLERVPDRLLVVGGGAVGCEFAGLFQDMGTRVTLVEKTDQLLPGEDPGVVRVLNDAFERAGVGVRTGMTVEALAARSPGWSARLSSGEIVDADDVLVCVGRRPALDGLGLDRAGVTVDGGRVRVDETLQTTNPRVYAVGDVNGLSLLAHAAATQGETAVDAVFGDRRPYRNDRVPRCLYTRPEVASVGEWAHAARASGRDVKTQRFFFKASARALASDDGEGFLQIVSEKNGGRILGAQMVGPHVTELIHLVSVALEGGLTTDRLRRVIFAHPTLAEGVREALSR